jgi:hypothetical protein
VSVTLLGAIPLSVAVWKRAPALWVLPAFAAAGILVLVNVIGYFDQIPGHSVEFQQAADIDANQLRLLAAFDPTRFSQVGTRDAAALQDTIAHMHEYSRTMFGRGYFNLPVPTILKPFHMTDNVSAIHLMSPFGRLGALAIVLAFGGLALAAVERALANAPPRDWRWLGALSALTLLLVSAYMILANLPAAPFTGRNVYLLAAKSTSDFFEGMLLFALAVWTLGAEPANRDGL